MENILLPHQHSNTTDEKESLCCELEQIGHFQVVADIFKLLGDVSRLRIFWLLCHSEECVLTISTLVNMSSPAVSHHLRQLRQNGFIVSRRVGKEVYYKASDTEQSRLLHLATEKIMKISCPI